MSNAQPSIFRTLAAAGLLLASQFSLAQALPDYIQAALASPDRTEAMTVRDANRKPGELLALAGVKPGDTVVELAGFGQYFTTLLSSVVGANGKVHVYDLPYTEARAGEASRAFAAAHPNTQYNVVDYNAIELPAAVDQVHIVLYYHDLLLNNIDTAAFNKKIFDALKPGGVYLIVDHNALAGSGLDVVEKVHRIDPAIIREQVLAAGFVLAEDSDLLANPEEDLSKMVFAEGTRGRTDQSVFKFVKPQ
jgi:predicted methyltransferase